MNNTQLISYVYQLTKQYRDILSIESALELDHTMALEMVLDLEPNSVNYLSIQPFMVVINNL